MEIITKNTEQTENVGKTLALSLMENNRHPAFIALFGEMGVGKTAFVRGFCSAIDAYGIKSPTYTIVNEHNKGKLPVSHFDMYRVESEDDLISIGYYDYLKKDGFCLCEWSENIEEFLPDAAIRVTISRTQNDEEERIINIEDCI